MENKIVSNYHKRPLMVSEEVEHKDLYDFTDQQIDNSLFFVYYGRLYCIDNFIRFGYPDRCLFDHYWQASDCYGTLIKIDDQDLDHIIVGQLTADSSFTPNRT